jgi:hypothetical protein
MYKTIIALVLATASLGATSVQAGTCATGTTATFGATVLSLTGDVSDTNLCAGSFSVGMTAITQPLGTFDGTVTAGLQQIANELTLNDLLFGGADDWTLAEMVGDEGSSLRTTSNDNGLGFKVFNTNGTDVSASAEFLQGTGQWSVTGYGADTLRAAVMILNSVDEWGVYLLSDLALLRSGTYAFNKPGSFDADTKDNKLQSMQLYVSRSALTPIPVPAALPMLLIGLGGIAVVARRRRRAAD